MSTKMKQLKSIFMLLAFLVLFASCSRELEVTPCRWLDELSKTPVLATADVSGMSLVTKDVTTTTASLESGFNVKAYNTNNTLAWSYLFTPSGEGLYTHEDAKWMKAGNMIFRASYPKAFSFNDDGTIVFDKSVSTFPLVYDPVVAVTTAVPSEGNAPVNFKFYHVSSQIRMNVENNSDWDIRVNAKLVNFYGRGTFTYSNPVEITFEDGISRTKLPASTWSVTDADLNGAAVGNTAGSLAEPLVKGAKAQDLLISNIVPVPVVPHTGANGNEIGATQVVYTIYWTNDKNGNGKEDMGEAEHIEITREVTGLVPGVVYIYTLTVNGDYTPQAAISTAVVDDFASIPIDFSASPWAKNSYTVALSSNNTAYGSVVGEGTYTEGAEVTISAVPAEGYVFKRWSDGVTEASRTFNISGDMNLQAIFAEKATWNNLYIQFSNAWQVTSADAMTVADDNHTWTRKVTVTESNQGWDGTYGFLIPTGTGYNDKIYNLDSGNPGHLKLQGSMDPYVYIPISLGDWIITFNDKTLEYTITAQSAVRDQLATLITWLEDEENDPNEYEYTEESLDAYNAALAAAKAALAGTDYDAMETALDNLRNAYYGLVIPGSSAPLPDLPNV